MHRPRRRVRLIAQPLLRSSERCYIVEILLRRRPEIKAVRAVPEIGSLAVHYDPGRLPEVRLQQIIAGLVMILLGLDLLDVSPWRNALGFAPLAWLRHLFVAATARGVLPGAINGLMPCSMTLATLARLS